jgi:hypothetical protein
MALGSTQLLIEMNTRNLFGVKWRPARKMTTSLPSMSRFFRKCERVDVSQPYGPPRPITGIVLPLSITFTRRNLEMH